jgi:hypothetical protein
VVERAVASGDLPAMPAPLNIASLVECLEELGVAVDNQRPERGLMVYRTKAEFGRLVEHLKRGGVEYWFHPKAQNSGWGSSSSWIRRGSWGEVVCA